jgi:hypothetical protein
MRTGHRTTVMAGTLVLVAAMAVSVGGCGTIGGETISGSGRLEATSYDFADFTEVDVSSAFDVDVTNADTFAVEVTVDDNIVENLDVRLDGETLRIGLKGPDSYRDVTLDAAIAMPALNRLKLSGASKAGLASFKSTDAMTIDLSGASAVTCSDVASGSATFKLQGASKMDCSDLQTANVSIDLQGASNLGLAGTGDDADIKAQGASQARLGDFSVADATLKLEGASSATVNASGTLDVDLAGSSDLVYLGEPSLGKTDLAGDSTLKRG